MSTRSRKLDDRRKVAQVQNDQLRSERNAHAKAVGMAKGRGEDIAPLIAKGDELTRNLAAVDKQLADIQAEVDELVARLPNLLHESVPDGRDETGNVEVRRWGTPRALRLRRRKITSPSAKRSAASISKPPAKSPAPASS